MAIIPYDRITNLQNDQALAPSDPYPAPKLDQEYNAIKITTDDIIQHLDLIQRDDGQLENDSVGFDQLREEVLIGFDAPAPWITDHDYVVGNTVFYVDGFYYCVVDHKSGVFATDLAAGKWSIIADFGDITDDAEAAAAAAAASAAAAAADAEDAQNAANEATAAQGAFRWTFDTSTVMADPGVGEIRGNGTPASAMTAIAVSAQTADPGNPNILAWLLTWDDSTNTASRGTIYVRKVSAPQNFAVFNLTGTVVNNGSWAQIGVTYVTHAGSLGNGEPMSVAFMRTGNQGAGGSGSGDMLRANNLSDVVSVATSRTNLGVGTTDVPVFSQVTLGNDPTAAMHAVTRQYAAPFDAMAYNGMQVNGSMEVSQELGTTGSSLSNTYPADQWKYVNASPAVASAAQSATFPKHIIVTITTAGTISVATDAVSVRQFIEGYRISRLRWGTAEAQPITLGFWTAHARTGTYGVSTRNATTSRSYVATYTQTVADVFEYKTVTIPGDTSGVWETGNLAGMTITFTIATGSSFVTASPNTWIAGSFNTTAAQVNGVGATSDRFRITGVVVLPGTQAPTAAQSPLIMRPYDQELVTCKRYWNQGQAMWNGWITASQPSVSHTISFEVPMRVTPTMTHVVNGSGGFAGFSTSGTFYQNSVQILGTTAVAGAANYNVTWKADARL